MRNLWQVGFAVFLSSGCSGKALVPDDLDTSTGGSGPEEQKPLGGTCETDEPCPSGSKCLKMGADGGESGTGICSRVCSDPTDCGEDATCQKIGDERICVRTCSGSESLDAFCGATLTCDALGKYCRPQCTTDENCAVGVCDNASGLCKTGVSSEGDPVGSVCAPEGTTCGSVCTELDDGYALCSAHCSVGSSCPDDESVCVNDDEPGRAGVAGSCIELCNAGQGCKDPEASCDSFEGREWLSILYGTIYDGLCLRSGASVHVGAPQ